jgi:cyclic lactone autoinducer peptide
MKKIRTLSLKWSGAIAALALVVATLSTGITCCFTAYQPELPEQLKQ